MDKNAFNFLLGAGSPAPSPVFKLKNPRANLHKVRAPLQTRSVRARNEDHKRKTRKDLLLMSKRGIKDDSSDEEKSEPDKKATEQVSKGGVQERLIKLAEFKRSKELKKKLQADALKRRPPFKVGVYRDFGMTPQAANKGPDMPWKNVTMASQSKLFVFKGNNARLDKYDAPHVSKSAPVSKILTRRALKLQNESAKENVREPEKLALNKPSKQLPNKVEQDMPKRDTALKNVPLNASKDSLTVSDAATEEKNDRQSQEPAIKETEEKTPERKPVADFGFKTPQPRVGTPKASSRTPRLELLVQVTTPKGSICYERGNFSDKRRQQRGKSSITPAEILQIQDLIEVIDSSPQIVKKIMEQSSNDITNAPLKGREVAEEGVHDVDYFKNIVDSTDKRLADKCQIWNAKMDQLAKDIEDYEEICSIIRSTVGKANLLMNKKGRFIQIRDLISNCELGLGENKTTCMDLQGFWEMIYYQVEDVEAKFNELDALEANHWKIKKPEKVVVAKPKLKKMGASGKVVGKSNLRQVLAEKRKAMLAEKSGQNKVETGNLLEIPGNSTPQNAEEVVNFDAGFFNIVSSPKSPTSRRSLSRPLIPSDGANDKCKSVNAASMRKSLLNKRVSMSVGVKPSTPFAVMAATSAIRRSMSRETTPVVKTLRFEEEGEGSKENVKQDESPITSLLGPSRKSIAAPADNLMEFDSSTEVEELNQTPLKAKKDPLNTMKDISNALLTPLRDSPINTPRRSARLSMLTKPDYKQTPYRKRSPSRNTPLSTK